MMWHIKTAQCWVVVAIYAVWCVGRRQRQTARAWDVWLEERWANIVSVVRRNQTRLSILQWLQTVEHLSVCISPPQPTTSRSKVSRAQWHTAVFKCLQFHFQSDRRCSLHLSLPVMERIGPADCLSDNAGQHDDRKLMCNVSVCELLAVTGSGCINQLLPPNTPASLPETPFHYRLLRTQHFPAKLPT